MELYLQNIPENAKNQGFLLIPEKNMTHTVARYTVIQLYRAKFYDTPPPLAATIWSNY